MKKRKPWREGTEESPLLAVLDPFVAEGGGFYEPDWDQPYYSPTLPVIYLHEKDFLLYAKLDVSIPEDIWMGTGGIFVDPQFFKWTFTQLRGGRAKITDPLDRKRAANFLRLMRRASREHASTGFAVMFPFSRWGCHEKTAFSALANMVSHEMTHMRQAELGGGSCFDFLSEFTANTLVSHAPYWQDVFHGLKLQGYYRTYLAYFKGSAYWHNLIEGMTMFATDEEPLYKRVPKYQRPDATERRRRAGEYVRFLAKLLAWDHGPEKALRAFDFAREDAKAAARIGVAEFQDDIKELHHD